MVSEYLELHFLYSLFEEEEIIIYKLHEKIAVKQFTT